MSYLKEDLPLIIPSHILAYQCKQCGQCCIRFQQTEEALPVDSVSYDKIVSLYKSTKGLGRRTSFIKKNKAGKLVVKFANHSCIHHIEGKCRIQSYGGEYLPDACKVYPRRVGLTSRGIEFSLYFGCEAAAEMLFLKDKIAGNRYSPESCTMQFTRPNFPEYSAFPEKYSPQNKLFHYYYMENLFIRILQSRSVSLPIRMGILGRLVFAIANVEKCENWPKLVMDMLEKIKHSRYNLNTGSDYKNIFMQVVSGRVNQVCHDYDVKLKENIKELSTAFTTWTCSQDNLNYDISWEEYVSLKQEYCSSTIYHEFEYVFENYLVNFILHKFFFMENDWKKIFLIMAFLYAMIQFSCVGYCRSQHKQLSKEILIRAISELDFGFLYSLNVTATLLDNAVGKRSDEEQLAIALQWIEQF